MFGLPQLAALFTPLSFSAARPMQSHRGRETASIFHAPVKLPSTAKLARIVPHLPAIPWAVIPSFALIF